MANEIEIPERYSFTENEREQIRIIYKKLGDGESITPEEAELMAIFERQDALMSDYYQQLQTRLETQMQADLLEAHATAQTARANFRELATAAKARFERLSNGD